MVAEVIDSCKEVFTSTVIPVTYSHIITGFIAIFLYIVASLNSKKTTLSSIFLIICVLIFLWTFLDWVTWFAYESPLLIQAAWAPLEFISSLMFLFVFYFVYSFVNKNTMPMYLKCILGLLIAPLLFLAPTHYYMTSYNFATCEVVENVNYLHYSLYIKILFTLLSAGYLFQAIKFNTFSRKVVIVLLVAVLSFLGTFMVSGYIASYTENYLYSIYGLLGAVVFLLSMEYLVISEGLFETRTVGAQIFIGILFIINFPSIFFAQETIDKILWAAESIVIIGIGYFLITSVKEGIEQRKTLEEKNFELIELNATKTEFLSFASHQLKSPLTSIKWGMSAMKDTKLDENQSTITNQVMLIANQMIRTVTDFLNSTKLESGELQINKTLIEMSVLVQKIVNEFHPIAEMKHIALCVDFPMEQVQIQVDETKIEQVIANFIDNATKYTKEGVIAVKLLVIGDKIRLEVSDTGSGMEKGESEKLFHKYIRGSAASHNSGGSGIGLYLGKEIIELHGGTIGAYSEGLGKGSTFWFELPFPVVTNTVM